MSFTIELIEGPLDGQVRILNPPLYSDNVRPPGLYTCPTYVPGGADDAGLYYELVYARRPAEEPYLDEKFGEVWRFRFLGREIPSGSVKHGADGSGKSGLS